MTEDTEPRCGRCRHPAGAHRSDSRDPEAIEVLLALLGCKGYALPRAALAAQRQQARAWPIHGRCATRHDPEQDCP